MVAVLWNLKTGPLNMAQINPNTIQWDAPPQSVGEPVTGSVDKPLRGGVIIPAKPDKPKEAPAGYRYNAAGNVEFIPGGPADPNAPGQSGTGEEGKNVGFYIRVMGANRLYENQGIGPRDIVEQSFRDNFPNLANTLVSGDARQVADVAQDAFVEGILRSDSGAAVPTNEITQGRVRFFPQPGDRDDAITAKKQLREQAIAGVIAKAGTQAPKAFSAWNKLLTQYQQQEKPPPDATEATTPGAPKIEVATGESFSTEADFKARQDSADVWAATQGLPFDQALAQFNAAMQVKGYGPARKDTIDILQLYENGGDRGAVVWELPSTGKREGGAPGRIAAAASGLFTGIGAGLSEEIVQQFDPVAAAKLEAAKQYGRKEYPGTTLASEVVGGILSPLNKLIPGAPATAPFREAVKQATKQGALYGGVSGAGEAPPDVGIVERIPGAVAGTVLGGTAGKVAAKYVTPAVTSAVENYVAPVVSRFITPTAGQAIPAAEAAGIPILTSDIVKPRTWFGKWMQETMEKVPVLGTGGPRAAQREAREAAITKLYDDVRAGTAEIDDITSDFLKVRGDQIGNLVTKKQEVFANLTGNSVDANAAIQAIDRGIARYQNTAGYESLVDNLIKWRSNLIKGDINVIEDTRKLIGDAGFDQTLAPVKSALNSIVNDIYPALNQDMGAAIQKFGKPGDFSKWKSANEALSDFATDLEGSTVKRVLARGTASPEEAASLLFSKKPSEVRALFGSLSEGGKKNARALIVHRMVEKAGGLDELSPAKFTRQLKDAGRTFGIAFESVEAERLTGLLRALQFTRRADQAAVTTPTGQALIPLFAGGAAGGYFAPGATGAAGVVLSTIMAGARIYETKAVKNLLVALSRTDPGSKAENNVLGSLARVLSQQSGQEGGEAGQAVAEEMAPPKVPTQ